ncbi:MAG: preprotein translocase YajC subunit [Pseudobdellovibrio sp.]|jgi:preprotein translocase subunit YajC|nr:preprotein translocase YajC subunit [Pseudobdellovibrio sp.]
MIHLLLNSLQAFAQDTAAAAAPAQQAPGWMQFVPFAVILAVMYFIVIRPQAKKQKEAQDFLSALRVGDQVVTNAGILGRVTALTDSIATLEIANQVQIKILRAQIAMSQAALQTAKKEGN